MALQNHQGMSTPLVSWLRTLPVIRTRSIACLMALGLLSNVIGWKLAAAQQIELVSHFDPVPGTQYADVWGEGSFAYLATRNNGVFIIDISDPSSPQLASHYGPGRNYQDVKVADGIGYFGGSSGVGVEIVDLSDPYAPALLSQISSANGGYDSTHNVTVHGGFLYLVHNFYESNNLRIFDVSSPTSPQFLWELPRSIHGAAHDMTVVGDRLFTSVWGGRTGIYDVSGLDATQPPTFLGSFISGSSTHSNWPTASQNVLAVARECVGCGVTLFDISDLLPPPMTSPAMMLSRIRPQDIGANAAIAHNPLIMDDYLYVSWYAAGLQVFDISDPTSWIRVGSYGTYNGSGAGYVGNWGVFPFLGTDRVLLSDMQSGLFIVDVSGVVPEPACCMLLAILLCSAVVQRQLSGRDSS